MTKEALVEEAKDQTHDWFYLLPLEQRAELLNWLSTALDRYATAQRAEGAREARERCLEAIELERSKGIPPSGHFTLDNIVRLIKLFPFTPTETDNHETV